VRRRQTSVKGSATGAPKVSTPKEAVLVRFEVDWEPLPESLTDSLALLHGRVSDLGWRLWDQALAPVGLRAHHAAILIVLGAEGPMVQSHLADKLMVDKAVMVRLLNELETMGMVERRPHPSDGRAFEIHLQDEGRRRLCDVERVGREMAARFYAPLAPEEQRTLQQLLVRLATSNAPRGEEPGAKSREKMAARVQQWQATAPPS
jgi:MarR family transcriptional regulator, lower aerobic nicotinate degradation pathway regulator